MGVHLRKRMRFYYLSITIIKVAIVAAIEDPKVPRVARNDGKVSSDDGRVCRNERNRNR
jgi:hypothetical protein